MQTLPVSEGRMQSEIEALRLQHPETQDLYREVCVLLFFRYGITPTANKLYQLVRKGSMSAPAEALAKFWETLREKSRIRIEHPDLPPSLRDAAGEMVGALWQRAQAAAQDGLKQLQDEARAQALTADAAAQAASTRAGEMEQALLTAQLQLRATGEQLSKCQAELARAQGEIAALQRQIDAATGHRQELQAALAAAQRHFAQEMEQQRLAAAAQEERHSSEVKRALLEVDRERGSSGRLQKELDQARRESAELGERHRQQVQALTQRGGELDGRVAELQGQRDQLAGEVGILRGRLEAVATNRLIKRAATTAPKLARTKRSKPAA